MKRRLFLTQTAQAASGVALAPLTLGKDLDAPQAVSVRKKGNLRIEEVCDVVMKKNGDGQWEGRVEWINTEWRHQAIYHP